MPKRGFHPLTPDDQLAPTAFCIRLTQSQQAALDTIAATETTSRGAVLRRLLTDGLRLHYHVQRLKERAGA